MIRINSVIKTTRVMKSIILLKPSNLTKSRKGLVDEALSQLPFIETWTIDWLDKERIIRIVCRNEGSFENSIVRILYDAGIFVEIFKD